MDEVEGSLDSMGLIPIKVTSAEKEEGGALWSFKSLFALSREEDLILFSRQLATLIGAGVPLTKSLSTLEIQMENPAFVDVIRKVRSSIEGGDSFHKALSAHPDVFPEVFIHLIEAGEAGGIMDEILDRLADMLEKVAENKAKVRSATLYPKIVACAIVVALLILMTQVVPPFAMLYSGYDMQLPWATRALIYLSDLFTSYWYVVPVVAVALYLLFKAYYKTVDGRFTVDGLLLKAPIFGNLLRKSQLARLTRVLGSLQRSGLPILHSLDIASRSVENSVIAASVISIKEEVRGGRGLADPMADAKLFPPLIVQMVAIGEETGNLDEMLQKSADYYEQQVDHSIRTLTTLLEPALLLVVFGMVAFIAFAIFLPMWDIVNIVKR